MRLQDANTRLRMYKDIGRRTASSTWVYAIAWPFIFYSTELRLRFALEGWILEAFFIVMALVRVVHFRKLNHWSPEKESRWVRLLFVLSMINIGLWGMLTGYALLYGSTDLVFIMTISLVGFCAGGVNNFSPYLSLCRVFMMVALLPLFVAVLAGKYQLAFLVIVAMFIIYLWISSNHQNKEYWKLLNNETQLREQQVQLDKLSRTDALTGLYNRRHFNEKLEEFWMLCSRQNTELSTLVMDIDHFKKINDAYGHAVGDQCLSFVSDCLRQQVHRGTDLVARIGGEEFAVLLPFTDENGAYKVAEAIRLAVAAEPFVVGDIKIPVTLSVGVYSEIPQSHQKMFEMISCADKALYQSKHQGRNCSVIYHPEAETT